MIHLKVSPFISTDPAVTHVATDWLFSDTDTFSNILEQSLDDTVNLTEYKSNLSVDLQNIYVKTRFKLDVNGTIEYTDYSNVVVISSALPDRLENHLTLVENDTALMTSVSDIIVELIKLATRLQTVEQNLNTTQLNKNATDIFNLKQNKLDVGAKAADSSKLNGVVGDTVPTPDTLVLRDASGAIEVDKLTLNAPTLTVQPTGPNTSICFRDDSVSNEVKFMDLVNLKKWLGLLVTNPVTSGNGVIPLPNNMLLQTFSATVSGGQITPVSFPLAFPNGVLTVVATNNSPTTNSVVGVDTSVSSNNLVNVFNKGTSQTKVNLIAIGY